jgi:hypothetical protein
VFLFTIRLAKGKRKNPDQKDTSERKVQKSAGTRARQQGNK